MGTRTRVRRNKREFTGQKPVSSVLRILAIVPVTEVSEHRELAMFNLALDRELSVPSCVKS
jgi:hypothetical protein